MTYGYDKLGNRVVVDAGSEYTEYNVTNNLNQYMVIDQDYWNLYDNSGNLLRK
jgi:hypothetical protein